MQADIEQPPARLQRQTTSYGAAQREAAKRALESMKPVHSRWLRRGADAEKWTKFIERRRLKLAKVESYSTDVEESKIHFEMRALRTAHDRIALAVASALMVLAIGITLACIAAGMVVGVTQLHKAMRSAAQAAFDAGNVAGAACAYIGLRVACLLLASGLAMWQPSAAGSGLPQVKSNLNGADVPGFLTWRTLVAKTLGITLVVATGFPLGKEGPMVHIGSIVAACISHLEIGPLGDMLELRLPAAQRGWVGMGAVAGIAAAFHAPLGGILYAFEEVCSYWSPKMTWRSFVCAVIVSTTARFLIHHSNHYLHDPSYGFVIGLNAGESVGGSGSLNLWEGATLGCFVLISVLGGAVGALYPAMVFRINTLRQFIGLSPRRWLRLLEVFALSTVCFTVCFTLPFLFECVDCPEGSPCARPDSTPLDAAAAASASGSASASASGSGVSSLGGNAAHIEFHRYDCADPYQHNELASLLHSGAEGLIFHLYARVDAFGASIPVIATALAYYLFFAILVFGVMLPSGNFIPAMVIGALLGRLFGMLMASAGASPPELVGVYAVVGSAAVLGGATRMTLTLTTILVEATQDVALLPPIMLALAISRAVGDALSPSFDDVMMKLLSLPYLEAEPPKMLEVLTAQDVMSSEQLTTLQETCTVGEVLRVLEHTTHNGFPILGQSFETRQFVVGSILRRQLLVLLEEKVWLAQAEGRPLSDAVREAFVASFMTRDVRDLDTLVRDIAEEAATLTYKIDLRPFMDPSPMLVSENMPLTRVYNVFNLIGVRHRARPRRHPLASWRRRPYPFTLETRVLEASSAAAAAAALRFCFPTSPLPFSFSPLNPPLHRPPLPP